MELQLSEEDRAVALGALRDAGFITDAGIDYPVVPMEVTERGRRAVGLWPSDEVDLAVFLDEAIDEALQDADAGERSKLTRLKAAAGDVGKAVTGLLTKILMKQAGLD